MAESVEAVLHRLKFELDFDLKREQESAIESLMNHRDVLAVLPTGYGKSLIFQMYVKAKKLLDVPAAALVICPLKSLIDDQVREAKSLGLTAATLQVEDSGASTSCECDLLFACAESVLQPKFTKVLRDSTSGLHKRISLIVVDESHTIESWTGKRNPKKEKSFRAAFGKLAVLRSLCKQGTPVLALTGTADEKTMDVIKTSLVLKNVLQIFISPNRKNLRISVQRTTKKEVLSKLDWLVKLIITKGKETPKTIIFCNTMKDVATVVNELTVKLGNAAFSPVTSRKPADLLIGIFHSSSWESYKEKISASLKDPNGKKTIVVATSALSMGVNFPDIRYIIYWGPARNLLDHHQEAGRAGRDGKQSDVIVIYHGQQLTHCEDAVKEFVKASGCLRVASYKPLDASIEPLTPGHDCCSHCRMQCKCQGIQCASEMLPFEEQEVKEVVPLLSRPVSEQDKEDLHNALMELKENEFGTFFLFDGTAGSGFSTELIQDIVGRCTHIFTIDDIMSSFPVFSVKHALKVLEVIQETFGDIPNFEDTFHILNQVSSGNACQVQEYYGYFDSSSDSSDTAT